VKNFVLFGVLFASLLLLGCVEEGSAESVSVLCRPVAADGAPSEYSCSFSNNGTGTVPVCVQVAYSGAASAPAARICASVAGMDTVTKTSVLAEAPASCIEGGEFSCRLDYKVEAVKKAEKKSAKSEGGRGEAKAEEKKE